MPWHLNNKKVVCFWPLVSALLLEEKKISATARALLRLVHRAAIQDYLYCSQI